MYSNAMRSRIVGLILLVAAGGLVPTAVAEEESDRSSRDNPAINVRKLFGASCSSCHAGYGMDAGKGPKLAGTKMTEEQIFDRIWNGKRDAMHAYNRVLTEAQAHALASYIKGLPAN